MGGSEGIKKCISGLFRGFSRLFGRKTREISEEEYEELRGRVGQVNLMLQKESPGKPHQDDDLRLQVQEMGEKSKEWIDTVPVYTEEESRRIAEQYEILKATLKGELKEEVKQEVKQELRDEVKQEVKQELRDEVKQEVKQELRDEVKQEVKQELKQEVKQEVKQLREEMLRLFWSMGNMYGQDRIEAQGGIGPFLAIEPARSAEPTD
ncbi:hypothetical protein B0O80DRAFT_499300 [Mortierella sp. GBAus27b]|nr:hypothetical protein B0O80DRAFT_499300 [Mortierella sp. GBAus27b]